MARASTNPRKGNGRAVRWLRAHVNYAGKDCLMWPYNNAPGYGQLGYNGRIIYAHRFMCELVNGPPPTPKHQAAHSCGRGYIGCVHPKHLSWKTQSENQKDRRRHGTKNPGRNGKITPEQDAQIRELVKTKTLMEVARMFGVTHSTIQYRLYGGSHKARRDRLKQAVA